MRRLVVVLGFLSGVVLALGIGIGVTVLAGLNPTWVTVRLPRPEGLLLALQEGGTVRTRVVEGQLWFILVAGFLVGLLSSVALALTVWLAGLAGRLRERRHLRALEDELSELRDLAAARIASASLKPPGPVPVRPVAASPVEVLGLVAPGRPGG